MPDVRIATLNGGDKTLESTRVERFRAELRGELLRPGEDGYEAARKVWNGMVDKRPALIARCTGTGDVVACVIFAREHDILISVRGGGHNYAGKAVCDGGLMIDLSPMKEITVDPVRRIARAQAGLKLGEFDRETQKFGLATTTVSAPRPGPGPRSPTGVAPMSNRLAQKFSLLEAARGATRWTGTRGATRHFGELAKRTRQSMMSVGCATA